MNDDIESQDRVQDCAQETISTRIYPSGALNILSREEVARLSDASEEVGDLLRRCALAVLNSGNPSDDAEAMLDRYRDFSIRVDQVNRGIRLEIENAPGCSFVDGSMIQGIREQLSAVVRDIVYFHTEIKPNPYFPQDSSEGITNTVFEVLRNARLLDTEGDLNLVVCWGGHSISGHEYDYAKEVGYQLGLRGFNICTGCGPGAMKGPMKGATIGHAKQRILPGRYVGVSEPGIIAAESPNPIVNELVIMPDIEKRLEAFVRMGHGIVVFPGGVGTAEEILYLLGLLLHPDNRAVPFPLIFSGPASSRDYFKEIDRFVGLTLGEEARSKYEIVMDDPPQVARRIKAACSRVREYRIETKDAFYFNWLLNVDEDFQRPFTPTHEAMANLRVDRDVPAHQLAANLRRVFSGIVSGNVKAGGLRAIREHGPFEIRGEPVVMRALDRLLERFVRQKRMRLPGVEYKPCYRIIDSG